jgi:hypothetical protein
MALNESTVEEAALSSFDELGYGIGHGPDFGPSEPDDDPRAGSPRHERASFSDIVLAGRLRAARTLKRCVVSEEISC